MEREFYDLEEWLRQSGDPTYGQGASDLQAIPVPNAPPPPVTAPTTLTPPPPPTTGGGKTPQQIEAEGREYDRQHGYIGGYMMNGVWVNGSPSSGGYSPGGSTTGMGAAQRPTYTAPDWLDAGNFDAGPAFTYKDFMRPTEQDMLTEPGFQFRLNEGRKALEASAAGKGVLRSGGTLKDILGYGQNFASQEYNNVYNRALNEYDTNRNNAFGNWQSQYGQRRDVYDRAANNIGQHNTFNLGNARNLFDADFGVWSKTGDWLSQPDS